jgi:cold shock CspA family protein
VERTANLARAADPKPPALARGVIGQLKHLSAGTDVPSTHLVSAHNSVGYGYIRTPDGDVFFDASAVTNRRFEQLTRNMTVEFALDAAPYLRTSRITVVAEGSDSPRG